MASLNLLSPCLDCLINILNLHTSNPYQNHEQELSYYEQNIKNTNFNRFQLTVKQQIHLLKINYAAELQKLKGQVNDRNVTPSEKCILRALMSKLAMLNTDVTQLLTEDLLNLYMDACELRQQSVKVKTSGQILNLIIGLIQGLATPLRSYFVYQQYLKCRLNQEKNKENRLFSLKNIQKEKQHLPNSDKELVKMDLFKQLTQKITDTPLHVLLEGEMRKVQINMKESQQICRICSGRIKLQNMEKHVKNCHKKSSFRQKLDQKNYQISLLLQELKTKSQQISQKEEKTKSDQQFKKLAKLIINIQKRQQRCTDRRCSLIGLPSQKNIRDRLQQFIQDFEQQNGEDPLLQKLANAYRSKAYIQKRINALQINSFHCCSEKDDNLSVVVRRPTKMSSFYKYQLKPSKIFIKQQENKEEDDQQKSENSSNSSFKKSIPQNDGADTPQQESLKKITLIRSKKTFSRKILKTYQEEELKIKPYCSLQDIIHDQEQEKIISLSSFQILKFLGQGAFGKVYMVRRKQTKDIYALKIIKISDNYGEKQLESIKNQHQIFKQIAGDHLVKAPFSFNEKSSHFFVLQYLPGGDLRKLLDDQVYFEEEKAKFYLAEIILAIEHLHKFNIIHRDLKPENLVVDKNGHLKLTDFGLSELQINQKLKNSMKMAQIARDGVRKARKRRTALMNNKQKMKLIGTPDYIAPQIINGTSLTNYTIDWWSLGVMAYELIIGTRPFCAQTIEEVVDNISNFNLEWPEVGFEEGMISPLAKDLICQLLNNDFMGRLGAKGADQIKSHPFFSGIDWQNIKSIKPFFLPKMVNIKEYSQVPEDQQLKQQIQSFIGTQDRKEKKELRLERFVRFDLLGSQTIETVQKIHEKQAVKMSRLKVVHKISLSNFDCLDLQGDH